MTRSSTYVTRPPRTLLLSMVLLVCAGPTQAEDDWTVSRILQLVEAREQGIQQLEATLEIEYLLPEGHRHHYERTQVARRIMAHALGLPPRSAEAYETQRFRPLPKYRVRYVLGDRPYERIDRLDADHGDEFRRTSTHTFDGKYWWSLARSNAIRDEGQTVPREGQYLGLDIDLQMAIGNQPVKSRLFAGALHELNALGCVHMATPTEQGGRGLVGISVRHPAGGRFSKEVLGQHVLWFDPQFGMALVSCDSRLVGRRTDGFVDLDTSWRERKWREFKEVSPGLWLPMQCWVGLYEGVKFPKTGDRYPPGFDFDTALPRDFRLETFLVGQTKARVLALQIGQGLGPDTFKPNLPKDVIVQDKINDKVYQTPDLIPVTLEDDLRMALAASRQGPGYGPWIWLIAINLLLLSALGIWLRVRRGRQKLLVTSSANSPGGHQET